MYDIYSTYEERQIMGVSKLTMWEFRHIKKINYDLLLLLINTNN